MEGVRKINDLVDNTGQMLKFSKIRRKYPTCRVSCLTYTGIVSAFPGNEKSSLGGVAICR